MRRAEWRVRADDPKSPFGWWWRGIVEEDRLFGFQLLALLGGLLSWALGFQGGPAVMSSGWLVAALARRRPRPDRLAGLLPEPPPPHQFRTFVTYCQSGMATGRDEVALTLVDGWLYAEGVRSHFAVRPEDVWRLRTYSDRTAYLVLADGREVRLSGLTDLGRIDLKRWHVPDRWMEGEPTFPPASVHPQNFARWWSYILIGTSVALLGWYVPWKPPGSLLVELVRHTAQYCGLILLAFGLYYLLNLKARDWSTRREIVREPVSNLLASGASIGEIEEGEPVRVRT